MPDLYLVTDFIFQIIFAAEYKKSVLLHCRLLAPQSWSSWSTTCWNPFQRS